MSTPRSFDLSQIGAPPIVLPIHGQAPARPDPDLIRQLYAVSSATASALLHKVGIRHTFIHGPTTRQPGAKVVGPAVTLQFMPQREDIASGASQEYAERSSALWHVLDTVEAGDVLAIQAFGDARTGCLGEMLITYFHGRGGIGIVVDGAIRDWPKVQQIDVALWTTGFTPNYASQSGLFPWAYNVPIACGGVLVLPGDIIIADDDGAVLIPTRLAPFILQQTLDHEDWESFSRQKLAEGGSIWTYYPLSDEGRAEYERWRRAHVTSGRNT
jgi:regulator of RNase E activity RraA